MSPNIDSTNSQTKLDKAMSEDQFNQIVEAILSGKYSWACLLILSFSGYNPLHYIPYGTYYRLMKANQEPKVKVHLVKNTAIANSDKSVSTNATNESVSQLKDLVYLEELSHQSKQIKGGAGVGSFRFGVRSVWQKFSLLNLNR